MRASRLGVILFATAQLLAPRAALADGAAPVPSLPGVASDVIAAAVRLETDAPSRTERSCRWCTLERTRRWAPVLGLTVATVAVALGPEPPDNPRWDTRNSFDDAIQDGLAGDSSSTRKAAATASTVLISALGAAFAADIYLLRDEYPVEQSLLVAVTTTGATMFVTESLKAGAGRERPYVRRCRTNPDYSESCNSGDDNAGFFSTHASESATMAGLLCARRLSRSTVTWADRLLCGAAAAASVTTGVLRITADEHYFTDVLAGWGTGVVFGAVLPLMLPQWSGIGDTEAEVAPLAGPGAIGLQYTSRF